MDNAEEVMQLLEEFSKIKPKDIPRELEEYLGYVAKTGDPVYQWSLVKCLFREKLMNVITDFYESTPTIELPPCPNVDPFNYERMKTGLLERLELFPSAPFTVQRLCELLTNPRKEYNRVDKYMRAIEKNILVVSTREPGSGKRQDGENNQSDAVLNGIPDSRGDVEDGINSPLLGTPPASNEVIVSTCSEQEEIEISDSSVVVTESDKAWVKTTEDIPPPALQDSPLIFKTNSEETESKELGLQDDSTTSLDAVIEESSELAIEANNETPLLDSVEQVALKEEGEELSPAQVISSVANDVTTSTPEDSKTEILSVITLAPESECSEATLNADPVAEEMTEDEPAQVVSSSEDETKEEVNISEMTTDAVNSSSTIEEGDQEELESNNVIVKSPVGSPQNDLILETNSPVENDSVETVSEGSDPDSSNEVVQNVNLLPLEDSKSCQSILENESEAEPVQDPLVLPEEPIISEIDETEGSPESPKSEENNIDIIPEVTITPETTITEETTEVQAESEAHDNSEQEPKKVPEIISTVEEVSNTEDLKSTDTTIKDKLSDEVIESTNEECDQERREGSIIHSTTNLTAEIEPVLAMEEVSVDQSHCGVEEEAMDVDESSQQMVMSEGENEGEPMDQSDQPQS